MEVDHPKPASKTDRLRIVPWANEPPRVATASVVADRPQPKDPEPSSDLEPAPVSPRIADRVAIPAWKPAEEMKGEEPLLPPEPLPTEQRDGNSPSKPPQETTVEPTRPSPGGQEPEAVENPSPGHAQVAEPGWPVPYALLEQLDALAVECETGAWAMEVDRLLQRLGKAMSDRPDEALPLLTRLAELRRGAETLAASLGQQPLAGKTRRAGHALERRLVVWKQTMLAGGLRTPAGELAQADPQRLLACLTAVDAVTHGTSEGRSWGEYLALDSLRRVAGGQAEADGQSRTVAKLVLERLARVPMNARQRQFIAGKPVAALRSELRRWADEPIDLRKVLEHLEQYERSAVPSDARLVAKDCRRLLLSSTSEQHELAEGLQGHYRNANLRVAARGELLNRLIPDRPDEYRQIHDVVGGRPVHGESLTSTDLAFRLIPDPRHLRMALEVQGEVAALTHSVSGPATFYNDSQSVYRAWKEIEVGPRGMLLRPAQVSVSNDVQLRSVSTDFDPIPLVGSLVREVARSQHESQRCEMSAEVEQKVWARAKEQIDREADARLGGLAERLKNGVLEPVAAMSLGPEVIGAETTADRVVMRLRLASDEQLGGHTPRPQAPADSFFSMQLHESAANNLLEQLRLDGGTFRLPELRRRIAARLPRANLLRGETENDDVAITFAAKNSVHLHFHQGQAILSLALARLEKSPHAWENFEVRVAYRPQVRGRSADLARDEVIELIGDGLNMRSQIALRGVFSKTFPRQQVLQLVPEWLRDDPRLKGLEITQLAFDDGWLGLALGPSRAPGRPVLTGQSAEQ